MNSVNGKELFEFQNSTIKAFHKSVRELKERFELSKTLDKQIETIKHNLDTYEIMYDTLLRIREVGSEIMKSEELETIEREVKVLNDTFWD